VLPCCFALSASLCLMRFFNMALTSMSRFPNRCRRRFWVASPALGTAIRSRSWISSFDNLIVSVSMPTNRYQDTRWNALHAGNVTSVLACSLAITNVVVDLTRNLLCRSCGVQRLFRSGHVVLVVHVNEVELCGCLLVLLHLNHRVLC
jgi:hypothetical protein